MTASETYRVRRGHAADAAALGDVERRAAYRFGAHEVPTEILEATTDDEAFIAGAQAGCLWVACSSDGETVGFALASFVDGAGHLEEISVLPAHGRRGIGRMLLAEVEKWAIGARLESISLSTFRDIPWNAPFYSSCGYRVLSAAELGPGLRAVREREAASGFPVERRVFMQRTVGESASAERCRIVGIVNITEDSFSDGGRYLDSASALNHARSLRAAGADFVELGPASSHPDSQPVEQSAEIERLRTPLQTLVAEGVAVSVDSCRAATLVWAMEAGAAVLNDITGFGDPALQDRLADGAADLVVMHSIQRGERADRRAAEPQAVIDGMWAFFDQRLEQLERAGIERERLIVDPGMGLFLGSDPTTSFVMLATTNELRRRYGLPVMISVSRKSFLGAPTGAGVSERGAATLAAELYAARQGAAYLRTHDVRALADGLAVESALAAASVDLE